MREAFIIADVAGQFDALMRLIRHCPKECKILAVGDLIDRGPESFRVLEWFMKHPRTAESLMGNHEHMMLDYYRRSRIYSAGIWEAQGGLETLASLATLEARKFRVADIMAWMATRPLSARVGAAAVRPALVTHAPLHARLTLEEASVFGTEQTLDTSILWNRSPPRRRGDVFQIFGHNAHWGLRTIGDDEGTFALCIDQSRSDILTAVHWPSLEIFEEPYEL